MLAVLPTPGPSLGGSKAGVPIVPGDPETARLTCEAAPLPPASRIVTVMCEAPPPAAIDYYGMIGMGAGRVAIGDSVVFGFRPQIFVTRANVVGLSGVSGTPTTSANARAGG